MNKQEFLKQLQDGLSGLPKADAQERLAFYSEILDDRMEDGLPEEEAVAELGSVDDIVRQIVAETPLTKIAKEKIKRTRKFQTWEIVLLAVGSPIWVSLLICAFSVVLSLYVSLWSVIIALWAVFGALAGCGAGGVAAGILFAVSGQVHAGIATVAAALACAGLAIVMFFACSAATKGILWLTKKVGLGIKNRLVKKEAA